MLYKYNGNGKIEMLPSYNFRDLGKLEKDLENLLANNLADLYAEEGQLMPIFQERSWQSEPDLCALNRDGDLFIFELKRGIVPGDTTIQVMRYCQEYGQKNYFELCTLYKTYTGNSDLATAHANAFGLDSPLPIERFNKRQKLIVVGSSSDLSLMNAVGYWQRNGIDIDYIPYRFYKINNETYFEFFAKPFNYHVNVADSKGIIFDTNKTYGPNDIWDMFKHSKVSAYGSIKSCVKSFKKDDFVLYYHKGWGVVGAGKIKSSMPKENTEKDEMYLDVEMLTPAVQCERDLACITVAELRELLNKNFFWAKTTKVPYLSIEESKKVVAFLLEKYDR